MSRKTVSATALITAFARAYHSKHDTPVLFDDYLAEKFLTEDEIAFFGKNLADALPFFNPELAATGPDQETALDWVLKVQNAPITISRARYTEDCLKQAVDQGIEQYVILGAGMETFAFRETEMMKKLRVYEVDHPATQAFKQERLADLGWEIPDNLEFIPADFSKEKLSDVLKRSSCDPDKKTFFSWLGVAYYLSRDIVLETLFSICELASKGSIVVFDYIDSDGFDPAKAAKRMQLMQAIVQNVGEPMKSGFDPVEIGKELASLNLHMKENLDPSEIEDRYFKGRSDGYHAFEHVHFFRGSVEK
ncbi:MAG: class I SAM-dependent methyltransferase [Anaerolineales bacterium]|nr:class I SAM-dependent methyltransferase [Anaerolineales bacterium]